MNKKTEPTIHDIARELNISASTVSRALNNNPRISQKTRDKIKAAADKLGYRPNTIASNLRNQKSNTIGIVVPMINRHFFSSVISGVEDVAFKAGYNVIISQSNDNFSKESTIVHSLFSNRVDGLIISIGMQTQTFAHLELFIRKHIPLVFFDRVVDEIDADKIVVDDFGGAFQVTQHLIDQGCRRIAHIAGPQNLKIYTERKRGYQQALSKNGLSVDQTLILYNNLTAEDGQKAIRQLLSLPNPPDAIFCANDTTALSVMIFLRDKGIKVPEDVALCGFSNEPFSEFVSPSISTIKQPGFEMGQKAAELLIDQIEKKGKTERKHQTFVMPTELIVRQSSSRK
jgi:LacI family transcriptional regulator